MAKKRKGSDGSRGRCCCFGITCVLCVLLGGLFGAKSASADPPVAVIKSTPLAMPVTVLGVTNPYLVAAAVERPRGFLFSEDIRDLARQVEKLARHGVDLNQHRTPQFEQLELRLQPSGVGGVLQLRYRR
jgi:hypothetical protein